MAPVVSYAPHNSGGRLIFADIQDQPGVDSSSVVARKNLERSDCIKIFRLNHQFFSDLQVVGSVQAHHIVERFIFP